MYVCTVSMYVRMYCTYVCMYVLYVCMYVWFYVLYVLYVCMYGFMYIRMYILICVVCSSMALLVTLWRILLVEKSSIEQEPQSYKVLGRLVYVVSTLWHMHTHTCAYMYVHMYRCCIGTILMCVIVHTYVCMVVAILLCI